MKMLTNFIDRFVDGQGVAQLGSLVLRPPRILSCDVQRMRSK